MLNVLRIFFTARGASPWLVLLCLVAASLCEGIGLASLVPLLGAATGSADQESAASRFVNGLLGAFRLEPTLGVLVAVLVTGVLLKALITLLAMRQVGYASAEVATGLRAQIVRQLLGVRWGHLLGQPAGRIANAFSGEVGRSHQAYQLAAQFVAQAVETAVLLLLALVVSWRLALAAVAIGLATGGALHFLVARAKRAGRAQTRLTKELVGLLTETVDNLKPIKAMGAQDAFAGFFERRLRKLRRSLRRQVVAREALRNGQDALLAVCLGVGAYLAIGAFEVSLERFVVVGVILSRSVKGISRLQAYLQQAAVVETPFLEVQALIADLAAHQEAAGGGRPPRLEAEIRFEGVTFAYAGPPVLAGATLTVPAGRITVLTGASGAGKTTLVDLVLGLNRPQAGTILVDGADLAEIDLQAWRLMVGYVPQELVLFHDTVRENLTLGDPARTARDIGRALRLAGAADFVAGLPEGLGTVVGARGARLSGGQRQRIALARALVRRPRLLILDEVTSALDPETERAICRNIEGLRGRTTVLAVTHRQAFLDIADRVYRLDGGVARRAAGEATRLEA